MKTILAILALAAVTACAEDKQAYSASLLAEAKKYNVSPATMAEWRERIGEPKDVPEQKVIKVKPKTPSRIQKGAEDFAVDAVKGLLRF